jgi:two-component system, cell cycle response regulator
MLNAILIENSLRDKSILKDVRIDKTWQDGEWILHSIKMEEARLTDLQESLHEGSWYVHLWKDDKKEMLVLFKERSFTIKYEDTFTSEEPIKLVDTRLVGERPVVILIDNDEEYLITAKHYIEQLNYRVIAATTAPEALEIIYNLTGPAIILVEYHLEGMTGLELIGEIEKVSRFAIEAVLVTAQSDHKILALAKQVGCDYFVKESTSESPVNLGELYKSHIVSAEMKLKQKLKLMSRKMDPLTGFHDRESILDIWVKEWKRAHQEKTLTGCVFIDINDLKPINDMYGHLAGDELIQAIAKSIQACVRPQDLVIRYGGDEFAVILPETGLLEVTDIVKRLENSLMKMELEVSPGVIVNPSIATGIAMVEPERLGEDPMTTLHNLYTRADRAMYKNKMAYKIKRGGFMKEIFATLRSRWNYFIENQKD